jgi:hypothetical protein
MRCLHSKISFCFGQPPLSSPLAFFFLLLLNIWIHLLLLSPYSQSEIRLKFAIKIHICFVSRNEAKFNVTSAKNVSLFHFCSLTLHLSIRHRGLMKKNAGESETNKVINLLNYE